MKHLIIFLSFTFLILINNETNAQTSAGSCWYLDYDLWVEAEYPDIHGNCGSSPVFNPGDEMTIEVWVRSYTFGLNMKIFGMTSTSFNDGYILGFENMHPYAQIFNPDNQEIPRSGNGPMPQDSAWVHLATTYSSTGEMINYLNGEVIGSSTVFPQNPISESTEPFIIGRAPWDFAWAYNGDLDEIRIWNVQHSQEEIKNLMFKELQGDESGLLAYYNFNTPNNEVFYDKTSNGNDGTMNNYAEDCFYWAESYAPVGDAIMYTMNDIQAAWFGKAPAQYNYIITDNGLTVIANGINEKEFRKYLVFGHDNNTGTTNEYAPSTAPGDFLRTQRTWYVNTGGNFASQLVFNLDEAAGGGEQLTGGDDPIYYTLLFRNSLTEDFQAINCSNDVNENFIIFEGFKFSDGYYAISHSSEQLAQPSDIEKINISNKVKVFPNPATDMITVENARDTELTVINTVGKQLYKQKIINNSQNISLNGLPSGIYILNLTNENYSINKKIILK